MRLPEPLGASCPATQSSGRTLTFSYTLLLVFPQHPSRLKCVINGLLEAHFIRSSDQFAAISDSWLVGVHSAIMVGNYRGPLIYLQGHSIDAILVPADSWEEAG